MRLIRNAALLAATVLAGCNPAPPINFSVTDVQASAVKADADLRSITVTLASPEQKTGPLPPDGLVIVAPWKEALTDAVNRAVIFNDDSRRHANLAVKVLKFDIPSAGIDMKTDVEAHYELTDRNSGRPIFDHVIATTGICPFDYAFLGAIRARESMNRAVQANISEFIAQYEGTLSRATASEQPPVADPQSPPSE
jgi:hypothetical protein